MKSEVSELEVLNVVASIYVSNGGSLCAFSFNFNLVKFKSKRNSIVQPAFFLRETAFQVETCKHFTRQTCKSPC